MQFYPIIAFIYLTSPQIPVLSNAAMRYSIEQRHKKTYPLKTVNMGVTAIDYFPNCLGTKTIQRSVKETLSFTYN